MQRRRHVEAEAEAEGYTCKLKDVWSCQKLREAARSLLVLPQTPPHHRGLQQPQGDSGTRRVSTAGSRRCPGFHTLFSEMAGPSCTGRSTANLHFGVLPGAPR